MSTEHIINQLHLHEQNEKKLEDQRYKEYLRELKRQDSLSNNKKIKTTTFINKDKSQQLPAESDSTKHELVRQMMEKVTDSGIDINENSFLEAEINDELQKVFGQKKIDDSIELSKQYRRSQQDPSNQNKKHTPLQQQTGLHATKLLKKNTSEKKLNHFSSMINDPNTTDIEEPNSANYKNMIKTNKNAEKNQTKQTSLLQQTDVTQFAKLMTEYTLQQHPNTKYKLEQERRKLQHRGLTTTEINFMEQKVGQVVKQHVMYDLKNKLINYHMSQGFSTFSQTEAKLGWSRSANQFEQLRSDGKLTADLSNATEELRHQAKQDLSSFLFEESVDKITKHSLGQISMEEFNADLLKITKAGISAGIELTQKELTDKICDAINHLGLIEFKKPDPGSQHNKEKKRERIISKEEALDDKLRHLYMMKALHPNLREKIKLFFKMVKCKNGMIQLGIYTEEKNENLKKQGEFLAAKQYNEELAHIFREEATLPHLSGEKFEILDKKKAFLLNRLESIGFKLKLENFNRIKHNSYREMYSIIKEDILQLQDMSEVIPHISVTSKLKHLKEVVTRLVDTIDIHDNFENKFKLTKKQTSQIDEAA